MIKAFKEEMGWQGKCMTYEALHEQLWDTEAEIADRQKRYERAKKEDAPLIERQVIGEPILNLEKATEKLKMRIKCLYLELSGQRKEGITPEMILKAKEYPLETLLNVQRKGNIRCIAHEDKNPSMSIKNNRAVCFSCGFKGDAIDVYMHLHGSTFKQAVEALQ